MGLCDFDDQIYRDRDLLDWAKEAPSRPGDYDTRASEEEQAAYEHDLKKWASKKPRRKSYADED